MKTRLATVLLALAFVASTPALVQAGAGGSGIGDTFMFDCYLIDGFNPPHVLAINDQFFPPADPNNPNSVDRTRTGVKLGKAKLLCTPAGGIVTSENDLNAGLADADHMKCYEAPSAGAKPDVAVQVFDPFGLETVKVNVPKFVCVGAIKCPVGADCPPSP
jgi:hypothetical protein